MLVLEERGAEMLGDGRSRRVRVPLRRVLRQLSLPAAFTSFAPKPAAVAATSLASAALAASLAAAS
eukprot:scaffold121903_cov39-Phaeocystis_antarctica.AAC.1